MVAVVQLVEHQVVILAVAGSSPVSHPAGGRGFSLSHLLFFGGFCTLIATLGGAALENQVDSALENRSWPDVATPPSTSRHVCVRERHVVRPAG